MQSRLFTMLPELFDQKIQLFDGNAFTIVDTTVALQTE
ncbi:ribosomal protein S19 [Pontibacter sp. HSC-36F09]|nr:ribosomal protein S19 [Pontibacter sp. HSC-36F09]